MTPSADPSATRHSEWLRGVLQPCVLQCLADGPAYGYAIIARLAEAGLGEIKGGTLYPLLARLETRELVTIEWRTGEGGPGRKYFRLTDVGRVELADARTAWSAFARAVDTHLELDRAPSRP
jgi:PadR family transcriptional regulator PadR